VILVGAAILLPPIDSKSSPKTAVGATIAVLAVAWLILTVEVVRSPIGIKKASFGVI